MKNNTAIQVPGDLYFPSPDCPITVRVVKDSSCAQHDHDYTRILHHHDFVELVIITGGCGVQVINQIEYPVVAGDVFLLQGCCEHVFLPDGKVTMANVMFDPRRLPLPLKFLRKLPGYHVIFQLEPSLRSRRNFKNRLHLEKNNLAEVESMVRRLRHEVEQRAEGFEAAALGILLELITFVSRHYASQHADNRAALLRMGELISRMERDFAADWSLARLAKLAATSQNHLLRLFRAATGDTPIDYLIQLRLRRGAELLTATDEPISAIADRCGFGDSNYFSKRFRALYGQSPRAYRQRSRG